MEDFFGGGGGGGGVGHKTPFRTAHRIRCKTNSGAMKNNGP